jgi:hypothetical protein
LSPFTDLDSEPSVLVVKWPCAKNAFVTIMRSWTGVIQLTSDELGLSTLVRMLRDTKVRERGREREIRNMYSIILNNILLFLSSFFLSFSVFCFVFVSVFFVTLHMPFISECTCFLTVALFVFYFVTFVSLYIHVIVFLLDNSYISLILEGFQWIIME